MVLPVRSLTRDYGERIEDLQFRLGKLSTLAASKEAWLARLEEIRRQGLKEARFLTHATAALASADLQTRIKQTVTEAGGELISTQVIPERQEERFTRVAVKVRMTGSTPVLREVLYAFETNKPTLFIENLNIRPIHAGGAFGLATKQPPKPSDRLSVDFDVVGYMRGGDT